MSRQFRIIEEQNYDHIKRFWLFCADVCCNERRQLQEDEQCRAYFSRSKYVYYENIYGYSLFG